MQRHHRLYKSPDPETFAAVIEKSAFRGNAEAVIKSLQYLEERFSKGHNLRLRPNEAKELAGYISAEDPHVKQLFAAQPFQLFFYPSATVDGTLILTLFVEARPEELRQRNVNYRNSNKFLFNPFITKDGMIRKNPEFHPYDQIIVQTTEHTAHSKFYLRPVIRGNKLVGITMLLHPFQRSRLVYDPSHDQQYTLFKERTQRLLNQIVRLQRIFAKMQGDHEQDIRLLARISTAIDQLRTDINYSGRDVQIYLDEIKNVLPFIPARRKRKGERAKKFDVFTISHAEDARQDLKKSGGRPVKAKTTPLRQLLLRFIRDTEHYLNMRDKRGHEAEYHSANAYSSRLRDLVLLDASSVVVKSFEHVFKIPVRRYMLSAEQLRQMRLKGGRGNVVVNMSRVPEFFERRGKPVEDLPFPVQSVGKYTRDVVGTTTQNIRAVSIDAPRDRRNFRRVRSRR